MRDGYIVLKVKHDFTVVFFQELNMIKKYVCTLYRSMW